MRFNAVRLPAGLLAALMLSPAPAEERWTALEGCEISTAGGRMNAEARCGTLAVPENPANPEGRRIELAYAVAPARTGQPADDPVVFLAGGPGQSARDTLPLMKAALGGINRNRDLIFLDQRGTGGSNRLDCDFSGSEQVWLKTDWERLNRELRACLEDWDADVRHYTTARGADDLVALLDHHGIDRVNLIGGSYGTRMAQVILRRHPERVRSVILDAVVPTRLHLGSEHGLMLERSLNAVIAACGDNAGCAAAFPDLDQAYADLKAGWRNREREIMVTQPRTGQGVSLDFDREVLAAALRFLAYNPETQMMIPYLVHEAATTGNPERLASQALIVTDRMAEQIAIGLNFAVGCSEDWPGWPRDLDQSHTLLGDSLTEAYAEVCDWWPAGEVEAGFHQPFDADVPVLILSGELDPVTPPAYGNEAAAQFSHSLHLVAPGRGHIVVTNHCVAGIAAEFVAQASVDDLDTGCMDTIGSEPFFLDLLGPAP